MSRIFRFGVASDVGEREAEVDFSSGKLVFPALRAAMRIEDGRVGASVLRGLVRAGGGTRSQFEAPCNALVDLFWETEASKKGARLRDGVLSVMRGKEDGDCTDDKLLVAGFKVLGALAQRGVLGDAGEDTLVEAAKTVRSSWRGRMRDVRALLAGLGALDEVVCLSVTADGKFTFEEGGVGRECIEAMMVLAGSAIPRVRRAAAESVYVALCLCDIDGFDGGCDEGVMRGMEALGEGVWEGITVTEARRMRNDICQMLGVRAPALARAKK